MDSGSPAYIVVLSLQCLMAAPRQFSDTCYLPAPSSWPLPWDLVALHFGWDQVMTVLGLGGMCSAVILYPCWEPRCEPGAGWIEHIHPWHLCTGRRGNHPCSRLAALTTAHSVDSVWSLWPPQSQVRPCVEAAVSRSSPADHLGMRKTDCLPSHCAWWIGPWLVVERTQKPQTHVHTWSWGTCGGPTMSIPVLKGVWH